MANAFFKQGRTAFAQGDVIWKASGGSTIRAYLIDIGTLTQAKVATGATNATPISVTVVSHGYVTGDRVTIKGALGNTAMNGTWTITNTGTSTFTLDGSVGNGAYTASSATVVPLTSTTLDFADDIAAAVIGTPVALTLVDATDGVLDANDAVFSAVTGATTEAVILVKWTGVASTSPLLLWLDTASSGLPVTPNGGDITVAWDNGANKIARL